MSPRNDRGLKERGEGQKLSERKFFFLKRKRSKLKSKIR